MSQIRDVSSLPIAGYLIDKLHSHGFRLLSDLQGVKPLDLAQEIGVAPTIAMSILRQLASPAASSTTLTDSTTPSLHAPTAFTTTTAASASQQQPTVFSAKDLVARMSIQRPIITFCKALDTMLGGGVSIGHVTEICGVPGIGKTQLLSQLALNVQIPEVFHGQGGEALFLDTEGSLVPERLAEMAQELSKHLTKLAQHSSQRAHSNNSSNSSGNVDLIRAQLQAAEHMTVERFLSGVHVVRCHDASDVHVFLHHLPAFCAAHPTLRLIVIDSVAFPFRCMPSSTSVASTSSTTSMSVSVSATSATSSSSSSSSNAISGTTTNNSSTSSSSISSSGGTTAAERQRQLATLAQRLAEVAFQHRCAVVVSNHVTTRISSQATAATNINEDSSGSSSSSSVQNSVGTASLVPALGDSWAHAITTRLLLHWDHAGSFNTAQQQQQPRRQRVATLAKSPAMPLQSVAFVVNKKGIRDMPNNTSTASLATTTTTHHIQQQQQQQVQQQVQEHARQQMDQVRFVLFLFFSFFFNLLCSLRPLMFVVH